MIINSFKNPYPQIYSNTLARKNYVSNSMTQKDSVAFKALKKIEITDPYQRGYEDIKLDENGVIQNTSKHLVINTEKDLIAISKTPNALNKYFILNTNLDLKDTEFNSIGTSRKPFRGIFDGNGYSIKNLTLTSNKNDVGLFASVEGAKIINLDLININIKGKSDVGGLIGYSKDSIIENCSVDGKITGKYGVGSFAGISECSTLKDVKFSGVVEQLIENNSNYIDLFYTTPKTEKSDHFGGLIGLDNGSNISGAWVKGSVKANKPVGGIIGNTIGKTKTVVENSCFEGNLSPENTSGAIVSSNANIIIDKCVALNSTLLPKTIEETADYNNITKISSLKGNSFATWNKEFWTITPEMLPRLNITKDSENTARTYLQDINNSRDIGKFPYGGMRFTPEKFTEYEILIEPPKTYEKNQKLVNKIKNSTNSEWLFNLFGKYTDEGWGEFNCLTQPENDEIILALVQNKHLPINRRYSMLMYTQSVYCTPLYIASRIKKPYIFAEMLKRNDLDFSVGSGSYRTSFVFNMMQKAPDIDSAYVLYTSQNPIVKEYVTKEIDKLYDSKSSYKLIEYFNKNYPNIPALNKNSRIILPRFEFEKEDPNVLEYDPNNKRMRSFDDVLRNFDVDINYKDSNGNNMANALVDLDDELLALTLFKKAQVRNINTNNKNNKGLTPCKRLLETGKNQAILAELIKDKNNLYETNQQGENAIHIFSKNKREQNGIKYIYDAINLGLSVNIPDNNGVTPLMNAIENKKYNMFNFLIYENANINLTDNNGQSALHYACINCENPADFHFIKTLISRCINTNIVDNNGLKAFDYLSDEMKALVNFNEEELKKINETIAQPTAQIKPILYDDYTQLLNDNEINSTNAKTFTINKFTKNDCIEVNPSDYVERLSKSEDKKELQAVLISCLQFLSNPQNKLNDTESLKLLNKLMTIKHPISTECIKKLCLFYPNIINTKNELGETPLMIGVDSYDMSENEFEKLCCIDNIDLLLSNEADVNELDNNQQNILHRICQTASIFLLSKVLNLNGNINQKDISKLTPIEYIPKELSNKMRNFIENYIREKRITVGFENILKRGKL